MAGQSAWALLDELRSRAALGALLDATGLSAYEPTNRYGRYAFGCNAAVSQSQWAEDRRRLSSRFAAATKASRACACVTPGQSGPSASSLLAGLADCRRSRTAPGSTHRPPGDALRPSFSAGRITAKHRGNFAKTSALLPQRNQRHQVFRLWMSISPSSSYLTGWQGVYFRLETANSCLYAIELLSRGFFS